MVTTWALAEALADAILAKLLIKISLRLSFDNLKHLKIFRVANLTPYRIRIKGDIKAVIEELHFYPARNENFKFQGCVQI